MTNCFDNKLEEMGSGVQLRVNYVANADNKHIKAIAAKVSEKFLRSAALMEEGHFAGLQIGADHEGKVTCTAYSDLESFKSDDNINWIFDECAATNTYDGVRDTGFSLKDRRLYTVLSSIGSNKDTETIMQWTFGINSEAECIDAADEYIDEMFETLVSNGAQILMLAGPIPDNDLPEYDRVGREGHGAILISLPHEMSLTLRTMISLSFPHMCVEEITGDKTKENSFEHITDDCFLGCMSKMLCALIHNHASSLGGNTEGTNDASGTDLEGVPIDELELSVRSYSCLKRAGIYDLDQLNALSEKELRRIRNLSDKCVVEIKDKMKEYIQSKKKTNEDRKLAKTKSSRQQLDELIGLEDAKKQVRKIAAFARMKKSEKESGSDNLSMSLNMEFLGNPGTAKTTVARILAGIFYEIGLTESDELVEVGRADLVAEYVGQTAIQVKEIFKEAKGKVLFIDEAYSLVDGDHHLYGDEAINTIVQEIENNREDTFVIFAGYPDRMKEFFDRNPGLRSRVPFSVEFKDYSADELLRIAELEASRNGFTMVADAVDKVHSICEGIEGKAEYGNGRFCRNLIENAILEYALRKYGSDTGDVIADYRLIADDFVSPEPLADSEKLSRIGFVA